MGRILYSDKQHIIELVEGLYLMGLRHLVVCPGSRSAPLTLAFARHGGFQLYTVIDERSAAYVALGLALSGSGATGIGATGSGATGSGATAVALVCTSGTALLNMGPAVAEAFYLRLPLLVLSADRPAKSIDQLDGQTIRQSNVFEAHTVYSGTLPEHGCTKTELKRSRKLMQEAWSAMHRQQGPAHLNVPLHEPLYALPPFSVGLLNDQPIQQNDASIDEAALTNLRETLRHASRILLVPGQSAPDEQLDDLVGQWLHDPRVVVLMEPVGNLLSGFQPSEEGMHNPNGITGLVYRHDDLLANDSTSVRGLCPDVMISWGLQIVGKRTRSWLRRQSEVSQPNPNAPSRPRHFRLDPVGWAADPYHNPPEVIRMSPYTGLKAVSDAIKLGARNGEEAINTQKNRQNTSTESSGSLASNETYQEQWRSLEQKIDHVLVPLLKYLPFGDLAAIKEVGRHIGEHDAVHIGNSMPIRYWQMLGGGVRSWWLHANRGTSGIDGVNSTALGFALGVPARAVWLITGDLSFVYDLNAFGCQERPDNLRIIVINNQGGDIFRLIDGPSRQPECEDLFATPRRIDVQALAGAWGCDTFRATTTFELTKVLEQLQSRSAGCGPAVVEVVTEPKSNQIVYQSYQKAILNPS